MGTKELNFLVEKDMKLPTEEFLKK